MADELGLSAGAKGISEGIKTGREAGREIGKNIEEVQKEAVDVAKAQANARIRERREAELKKDRYHLSLQGKYKYECNGEEHIIEPGTFFWFSNKLTHSALNVGDVDRITFVFDVPHNKNNP